MIALPWHKRNHRDAIEGYMGLTLDERGAYTTILDLIYDRGGPLPDNERLLAGYLEISVRKLRPVLDALVEKGKIRRCPDGSLTNGRAEKELQDQAERRRLAVESGANGGRARAEKQKKSNENNDDRQGSLKPASTYLERDTSVPKGTGGEPPIDVVKLLFDEGVALLVATGSKPSSARSVIGKWKNAHTPARVLDAVREARERDIAQPVEWIGPYLARRAAGGEHGAGETAAEFIARQAIQLERQTAERERLAEMERNAVKPGEAAAIIAAAREAARATMQ